MNPMIFVFGLIALVVAQTSLPVEADNLLSELEGQAKLIDEQYNAAVDQFFTVPQKDAEELKQSRAYQLKVISNLMTMFETTKYVIRKRVVDATKDILENHKTLPSGMAIDQQLGHIVINRALSRAMADGIAANAERWDMLIVYLDRFVRQNANGPRALARSMLQSRREFAESFRKLDKETRDALDAYCEAANCKPQEVIVGMDKLIDNSMFCPKCAQAHSYDSDLGTYPMFMYWEKTDTLIERYVDQRMVDSVEASYNDTQANIPEADSTEAVMEFIESQNNDDYINFVVEDILKE